MKSISRGGLAAVAAFLFVLAPPAFAGKSVDFAGKHDDGGKLTFTLEEGKKGKPAQIEDIHAYGVKTDCPDGIFPVDLVFFQVEPIDIKVDGNEASFEGRYKTQFDLILFKGDLVLRKDNTVKSIDGKLREAHGEAGLDAQRCDTSNVGWSARPS